MLDLTYYPCRPVAIVLDPAATDEQLDAAEQATEQWNALLHGRLEVVQTPISGTPELALRFARAAPMFHGVYEDEIGELVINGDLGGSDLVVTIAHELGHALGLWHVPRSERASVMNAGNLARAPDERDAAAVADVWGLCLPTPMAADTPGPIAPSSMPAD